MKDKIESKIIDLFRKVICSLTCIQRITKNKELKTEANNYIEDIIQQYNIYHNTHNVFAIGFKYSELDIVDFSGRCIELSNEDVITLADDLEFGFRELMEKILKERRKYLIMLKLEKNMEIKEKSQYGKNMKKILNLSLAFEDYTLHTKKELCLFRKNQKLENKLKNEENLSEEEKLKISNEILDNYNKLLDEVGRENFIFYDKNEDYIEYDLNNFDDKSQFDKNMIKILNLSLVFESYSDDTKLKPELLIKNWKLESEVRKNKETLTEEEKLDKTNEILDNYNKLLDEVGREHFTFYEDDEDYLEYNWDFNKNDKGDKNE